MHRAGVDDLMLRGRRAGRFQGHAALRAIPRPIARDPGAHGADVLARTWLLRRGLGMLVMGASMPGFGLMFVSQEPLPAVFAAKVEHLPVALGMAAGRLVNGHAANWIDRHGISSANKPGIILAIDRGKFKKRASLMLRGLVVSSRADGASSSTRTSLNPS